MPRVVFIVIVQSYRLYLIFVKMASAFPITASSVRRPGGDPGLGGAVETGKEYITWVRQAVLSLDVEKAVILHNKTAHCRAL